jgi:uncharacterized protein (DUF433 family)
MSGHTPFSELTKHFSAERLAKIQEEANRLLAEMTLQEQGKKHTDLQGIRRISAGIVQDLAINNGRPIIEGTRVFVDRIIGHLEHGMSMAEICHEYDLTPEQVMVVKQLSSEQVQYVKGYVDALENVAYE